jgi:hypothetical protein
LQPLPEPIASVNRQIAKPVERVAIFDRCKPPAVNDDGWRFIEGEWGHPSGARHTGSQARILATLNRLDAIFQTDAHNA